MRKTDYRKDLSPVGDAYKKKGLAPARDRVHMCELATDTQDQRSKFIMVDPWEALQKEYQPTARTLDHFDYELNHKLGGIDDGTGTGKKIKVQICLLGGADLVESFSQPGVWLPDDLKHILCDCKPRMPLGEHTSSNISTDGAFIIERQGTDLDDAISKLEPSWRKNIHVIHQVCSTKEIFSSRLLTTSSV
jgi:nicotinamide mononucleotide adenylyltransferase